MLTAFLNERRRGEKKKEKKGGGVERGGGGAQQKQEKKKEGKEKRRKRKKKEKKKKRGRRIGKKKHTFLIKPVQEVSALKKMLFLSHMQCRCQSWPKWPVNKQSVASHLNTTKSRN